MKFLAVSLVLCLLLVAVFENTQAQFDAQFDADPSVQSIVGANPQPAAPVPKMYVI